MPIAPGRLPKVKLTLPQVRILKALADLPDTYDVKELSRTEIARKAGVSQSMTGNIGPESDDPAVIEATSVLYKRRSLMHLRYVTRRRIYLDGGKYETYYTMTKEGELALAAYLTEYTVPELAKKNQQESLALQPDPV